MGHITGRHLKVKSGMNSRCTSNLFFHSDIEIWQSPQFYLAYILKCESNISSSSFISFHWITILFSVECRVSNWCVEIMFVLFVDCINMQNSLLWVIIDVANKWFLTRGSFQYRASFALLPSAHSCLGLSSRVQAVIAKKLPCPGKR